MASRRGTVTTVFEGMTGVGAWQRSAFPISVVTRRCAARALRTWFPAGILAIGLSCGGPGEAFPQETGSLVAGEDGSSAAAPKRPNQELGTQSVRDVSLQVLDVEIQRHLNELRREQLEGRGEDIDRWFGVFGLVLMSFTIVIALAGFLAYDRFRAIEQDARTSAKDARTGAEAAGAYLNDAAQLLTKIENLKKTSEIHAAEIKRIHQTTAEDAETAPEQATEAIEGVASNPEASPVDRTIARAVTLQRKGKNQEAIRLWRAIAVISEGQDDDLVARAWFSSAYLLGPTNREEAIADYNKAIELKPDLAEAYSNRGVAKSKLGHVEEAIADFDKAIELEPGYTAAYNNRGNAKSKLGHVEEAIADFDKAIELKSDLTEAYNNRGNAKSKLGHVEEAIADYNKAIELKPDLAGAYSNRGNAKSGMGHVEEAIADYNKAIELKPDFAEAYDNRGVAKSGMGHVEEAIADYNKAIELKPDFAEACSNRGVAKSKLGQHEQAIVDFDKAIELKPDFAEAYDNRGVAKSKLGHVEEAIADYNKAIELKPDLAGAYKNRSIAKHKLGRLEEATADFDKAIELDPDLGQQQS